MKALRSFGSAIYLSLALIPTLVAAAGCEDDQTVEDGNPSPGSGAAQPITLEYGSASATVDIAKLPTQEYKGAQVVPLSLVWAESRLKEDPSALVFDFEADDGFRPSSKEKCQKPLEGTLLQKGYITPDTRSLLWDDTLGFPGCYSVKNVKRMIGLDPSTGGAGASGG